MFAIVWMIQAAIRGHRREKRAADYLRLHGSVEGPPTLHPVIDPDVCIGSGACVRACPEDRALVLISGNLPNRTEVVSVRVLSYLEGGNPASAAALATVMLVVALLAIVTLDVVQRKVARRG